MNVVYYTIIKLFIIVYIVLLAYATYILQYEEQKSKQKRVESGTRNIARRFIATQNFYRSIGERKEKGRPK